MGKFKIIIICCCLCTFSNSYAQNRLLDSLKKDLSIHSADSLRLNTCLYIGNLLYDIQPDSARKYWTIVVETAAARLQKKSSPQRKQMFRQFYTSGLADLALLCDMRGDAGAALELYHDALRIMEQNEDKVGMGSTITNIANILQREGNYGKALEYYQRSIILEQESGDSASLATTYGNISVAYMGLKDHPKAIENAQQGLLIKRLLRDKKGIAKALSTLSSVYYRTGHFEMAATTLKEVLPLWEGLKDKRGLSQALYNLARNQHKQNRNAEAKQNADRALKLATELGFPEIISGAAVTLYDINKSMGNSRIALENYELHIKMRDSIYSMANKKATIKNQLRYEYEKQAASDSVAFAKEGEIKSAELSRQAAEIKAKKNQQVALFGGLFLVILFSIFMFNRFKVTQRQKVLIEHQKEIVELQKHLVEEKQKEILDSIKYAKRIQLAQIPTEKRVHTILDRLKRS
jgi:tetratricopeptide (TPR) repeat protein